MVAIPPTHPPTTAAPAPEQQRSTPHTPRHAHTQPRHRSIRRRHLDTIHTNGGFYYHRHLSTACRRRVAALWSQFPPRTHPQPPPLRPSNNAAPRTPLATPIHNLTTAAFADATSTPPAPTGGFTTIDAPPRRVAGVSHPYGRNSPHTPTHNHQPRTHSRPSHDQTQPPTRANGGFTTIDTSPRRVAGVSQPYGRNSPHAPTHNRRPCARATTQHPAHPSPRPYTTSPPQHSQTPPRHHPHQRGLLLP